jgi:hypothetical protein
MILAGNKNEVELMLKIDEKSWTAIRASLTCDSIQIFICRYSTSFL